MSEPTIQGRIALAIEAEADRIEKEPVEVSWCDPAGDIKHYDGQIEGLRQAARIARGTADDGWIAVADRLPPDVGGPADGVDAPWLLIRERGQTWMAYYAGGRWLDDEGQELTPTHWMPLPMRPLEADESDIGPAAHGDTRADAGGGMTWEAYNR